VMTSYQLRISRCVCGVISLCSSRFVRIVLDSGTGMLLYRFVMYRDAREQRGVFDVAQ